MDCQKCNYNNDADSKFCISCGGSLIQSSAQRKKVENILFVPPKKSSSLLVVVTVVLIFIGLLALLAYTPTDTESDVSETESTTEESVDVDETSEDEGNDSSWYSFTSSEYDFQIDFPKYPSTERLPEEEVEGITSRGTQYSADDEEENGYVAQAMEYGAAPEDYDNKIGLEGALNGMLETGSYTVLDSYFTNFSGYDALQFEIQDDTDGMLLEGIAFIRDDLENVRLYVLLVASVTDTTEIFNRFTRSFETTE